MISLPFGSRILLFKFTPDFNEYGAVFLYASDILMVLFLFFFSLNRTQAKPAFENQDQDFRNCLSEPEYSDSSGRNFFSLGAEIPTSSGTKLSAPAGHSSRQLRKSYRNRAVGIFSQTGLVWLFVLFLSISIFFASYKLLAIYNFIRLALLVLTALAIAGILKRNLVRLENILAILVGLAAFQSIIAFFQFLNQKSLGFWFLGESILGPEIPGVAKIVVAGGKILRAYGTFPHPNILAAFLLLGLFSSYYFLFRNRETRDNRKITKFRFVNFSHGVAALTVFLISLGLVLTFSRAAWVLGIFLTLFYIFLSKSYRLQTKYPLIILVFIFLSIVLIMGWLIFPRAQISLTEPSVSQRISYNELGWRLIKNNPWGIGLGNQVIYSVKNGFYQMLGMNQSWQWQPIHNIYFLIGSEIGVLGLLAFLALMAKSLIFNFALREGSRPAGQFLILMMFLALLLFGLFDHFFWTLQPGRLMFWLVLGIILGTTPRRSMDRTQASEV